MDNYYYFEYSANHLEQITDPYYEKNVIIIPKKFNQTNNLIKNTNRLIELISTFDTLYGLGHTIDEKIMKEIVDEVISILDNTQNINYSPFTQFFMVYNFTYSLYKTLKKEHKVFIIYDLLIKFCEERQQLYLEHGYSNSMLQIMCDNYSHKRNSKRGIDKFIAILSEYAEFCHIHCLSMLNENNIYFLPDKGDKELFNNFLKKNNISMKSRDTEQGKLPDIVFKYDNQFYICELKSMKEGGGGQNKQVVEMVNFIKFSEKNSNFYYLVFLDCYYSNLLFQDSAPKVVAQRKDIEKVLKENPGNYFINTSGLKELLKNIIGETHIPSLNKKA